MQFLVCSFELNILFSIRLHWKEKYQGLKNFTLVTRHLSGISDMPPSLQSKFSQVSHAQSKHYQESSSRICTAHLETVHASVSEAITRYCSDGGPQTNRSLVIITARKRSLRRLFLHVSVIPGQVHPPGAVHAGSRRYASYWNAFLLPNVRSGGPFVWCPGREGCVYLPPVKTTKNYYSFANIPQRYEKPPIPTVWGFKNIFSRATAIFFSRNCVRRQKRKDDVFCFNRLCVYCSCSSSVNSPGCYTACRTRVKYINMINITSSVHTSLLITWINISSGN